MPEKNSVAAEATAVVPETVAGTDVPPQKSVEEGQQQAESKPQVDVTVDMQTAIAIKVQEFDKKIAEVKAQVASLESQRASYIYEANLDFIVKKSQQKQVN